MFTRDDLIDVFLSHLSPRSAPGGKGRRPGALPGPRGRPFLSEHVIKKALNPHSQELIIPGDAIISPLAQDWLTLRGIRIVRR